MPIWSLEAFGVTADDDVDSLTSTVITLPQLNRAIDWRFLRSFDHLLVGKHGIRMV